MSLIITVIYIAIHRHTTTVFIEDVCTSMNVFAYVSALG